MGVIVAIILMVLLIVCAVVTFYCSDEGNTIGAVISGILAFIIAVVFFIVPFSIHTVDAGEVAVVKHFGKVSGIRESGLHYDLWMTNRYVIYDAKVQNVELNTMAYSSDAQTMDIQMTLQYEVIPDKVVDITNRYGNLEALQTRINSVVIEKTKSVLSNYKAMDIIADRASMSPAVEEAIRNSVGEEYCVNIVTVALTNIDFSDTFEKAVEDKMVAEQKKLQADYENSRKVAQAEADAKAKILEAEAEAKANELLESSITDKILQQRYIDKWDGKLPEVVSGDADFSMMVNR